MAEAGVGKISVNINIASLWSPRTHGHSTTLHTVDAGTQVGNLNLTIPELRLVDHYVLCNGRLLESTQLIEPGKIYHVVPRMPGGKGGFGSMLRAIGAQIEKTTSREACRDLSGRRMRDINNEKKLKEWLAKEADREKEKEERRAERLAKRLNPPQHKFEDSQYHEQKTKVQEDLQDALQSGLKRAHKGKNGAEEGPSEAKQAKTNGSRKEWLGVDIDSEDSDLEADPGTSHNEEDNSTHSTAQEARTLCIEAENTPESLHSVSNACSDALHKDDISVKTEQGDAENDTKTSQPSSSLLSMLPPPSSEEQKEVKVEECTEVKIELPEGPVDLESFLEVAALCQLGLDRLKFELMTRGLKCGGTQEERANRLWAVRGLSVEDYPPALVAKAKGKGKKSK